MIDLDAAATGPVRATGPEAVDLWSAVVGQPVAVDQLRAAVSRPVHAYLLVGPDGSGKRAAAMAFAADLLSVGVGADPDGAARTRALVASGRHPCVHVAEPHGQAFLSDDAVRIVGGELSTGEHVGGVLALKPPEGDRRVVVLPQAVPAQPAAFSRLLKAVEEPPPGNVFVICATRVPPEMVTIASRCVVVELTAVADDLIVERLVASGVDPARAERLAVLAQGSLDRANLLAADPGALDRSEAWRGAPGRLDGTLSTAMAVADELLASIDEVLAPLAERHEAEAERLTESFEAVGETPRKKDLLELERRHKREASRLRRSELRAGLSTVVATYRQRLAAGGSAEEFLAVSALVQELCDALEFNPNEGLQLRALFTALPPSR